MKVVIPFLIICFQLTRVEADTTKLHFSAVKGVITQDIAGIVFTQIYKELGIEIRVSPVPAKRARQQIMMSERDGEIIRIYEYGEITPNAIRVPTPYLYVEAAAFVHKESRIVVRSIEDLKSYAVGKLRGAKHAAMLVAGNARVINFDSIEKMLEMLSAGRIDVALLSQLEGEFAIKVHGIANITRTGPSLRRQNVYHYLHRKHAHLVPTVDNKLKELKQSGRLAAMVKEAQVGLIAARMAESRATSTSR